MPLEYDFVLTNVLSRILQNDKLLCVHFILISKSTDDQGTIVILAENSSCLTAKVFSLASRAESIECKMKWIHFQL